MGTFGEVAVEATRLLISKEVSDPRKAWDRAAQALGCSPDMRRKSCPRSAYLGLCEEGLVKDVPTPTERLTKSIDNKRYAVDAVRHLREKPSWVDEPKTDLWREVSQSKTKRHNEQIDVVLALWGKGLITEGPIPEPNSD